MAAARRSSASRAWRVETWFPFNLKNLRKELRRRGVGQVVVKKRGSPIQPHDLIRQLRLQKDRQAAPNERVLFLTQLNDRPIVILCWGEEYAKSSLDREEIGLADESLKRP